MEDRRWGYNNCRTAEIQEKVHRYFEGQINRMEHTYIAPIGREVSRRYHIPHYRAMQLVWEEVINNLETNINRAYYAEAEAIRKEEELRKEIMEELSFNNTVLEKKRNPIIAFFRPKSSKRNAA